MASKKRPADATDTIIDRWRRARPALDVGAMGAIGRLKRCAALLASVPEPGSTWRCACRQ